MPPKKLPVSAKKMPPSSPKPNVKTPITVKKPAPKLVQKPFPKPLFNPIPKSTLKPTLKSSLKSASKPSSKPAPKLSLKKISPAKISSHRIKTTRKPTPEPIEIVPENFFDLSQPLKENIIDSLFSAKYKGFRGLSGVELKVPQGYTIRFAALLTAEESNEVVKRIFVVLEEYNDFITSMDIDTISNYLHDLENTQWYVPARDDVWVVTNQKWTFEAYTHAAEHQNGHIFLMDMGTFLDGIKKYYHTSRELRDHVRTAGLLK